MNYKNLNDNELLDLIQENNEDAITILLKKYEPIIYQTAIKYLKINKNKGLEIDDLIQEGIYSIIKAIENYRPSKEIKFSTYAITCIDRNIQTICRKQNKKGYEILNKAWSYEICEPSTNEPYINVIEDTNLEKPLENIILNEFCYELKDTLFDLENECNEVFMLKYNGFSYKEIAKLLDISIANVGYYLTKARKTLKKRNLDQFLLDY